MSTIIVKYAPVLEESLAPIKIEVRKSLIAATAQALSVDAQGVIVEFVPWTEPYPLEAPEVLFRAETSTRRRELLQSWATALLQTWKLLTQQYPGIFRPGMKVAAKPYVIDSEWIEEVL